MFLTLPKTEQFDDWIVRARARLAARKNGRPSTKTGTIRALWPEIQQALDSRQTLKTIRDWLEAEGLSLTYNQLTAYVARIRHQRVRVAAVVAETSRQPTQEPECRTEPKPDPVVRDPLANLRSREGRPRTFEYNPEFKEEELL